MKNRIYNTLLLFVFGIIVMHGQSISGEFNVTSIGIEGTATLTVTANPPNVDQQPGEFQVLVDFPNDGKYVDVTVGDPIAGVGAPSMTWVSIGDGGGSNSWLGTNDNVVLATIGGGQWTLTVEGVGPDSGGNQVISVVSLIYADEASDGNLLDNAAGLILNELLPVEFSYFNARNQDCITVDLAWQTQSEINNDGFFVERSIGSTDHYESLGFVEGKGNSNTEQNYTFKDDINGFKGNGNVYYKIKQVDVDGRFDYSETVTINLDCDDTALRIRVYPNPTMNDLYVSIDGDLEVASSIEILNNLNQKVASQPVDQTDFRTKIDMAKYVAGVYYVRVLDNSGEILFTKKIIVTK